MSKEYLRQAYEFAAKNSTDINTQTGAILVDSSGAIVAWGANRFPRGVLETPERLERPAKYSYVVHAERVAILDAARRGVKTEGLAMYITWVACNVCAQEIVESGISKVIGHKKTYDLTPEHWREPIELAKQIFKEARVEFQLYEGDVGDVEILFEGKVFRP